MSDENQGTAETLAEGEVVKTPESETTKDFVTLADEDEEQSEGDGEEAADGEGEGEQEAEPEKPKKPSGSAKLKARLRAAEEELAEYRRTLAPRLAKTDEDGDDLKEPKESDFPNDYLAYDRALRAYETRKAIREENARVASEQEQANAQRAHRARLNAYNARLEDVKDRIPDFDATLKQANDVPIRDDVRDMILDDGKGPLIAYHLAKNPEKLDALNRMTLIEAAREIGKLSARIRGPQAKTVTKAKPPLSVPRGTGTVTSRKDPSAMSMEEYTAWADSGFK
jgi:hypothetical protein